MTESYMNFKMKTSPFFVLSVRCACASSCIFLKVEATWAKRNVRLLLKAKLNIRKVYNESKSTPPEQIIAIESTCYNKVLAEISYSELYCIMYELSGTRARLFIFNVHDELIYR